MSNGPDEGVPSSLGSTEAVGVSSAPLVPVAETLADGLLPGVRVSVAGPVVAVAVEVIVAGPVPVAVRVALPEADAPGVLLGAVVPVCVALGVRVRVAVSVPGPMTSPSDANVIQVPSSERISERIDVKLPSRIPRVSGVHIIIQCAHSAHFLGVLAYPANGRRRYHRESSHQNLPGEREMRKMTNWLAGGFSAVLLTAVLMAAQAMAQEAAQEAAPDAAQAAAQDTSAQAAPEAAAEPASEAAEEATEEMTLTGLDNPVLVGAYVDGIVGPLMANNNSPSGTVAITRNGRLIFAKGYGFQDVDQQIPVDPFKTPTVTPDRCYYRLHGVVRWRYTYEDGELEELVSLLPKRGLSYVFFNNITMFEDALRFKRILAGS